MKPTDVKILIVDDEPLLLETLGDLFETFHFQVDKATSGNHAWMLCEKKSYNLVLSDVRMSDGDGIELIKKIKQQNAMSPSFLFMSGFSDLLNEEIYHLGADGKFTKPFDTQAVRMAIQKCLLTPEAKWSQPLPKGRQHLNIKKVGQNLEELQKQKSVLFGRGGVFISHAYAAPEKGTLVSFSIQIRSPKPLTFVGTGIVRWIQNPGKINIPPGLGLEIIQMDTEHAKIYNNLFGNLVPFIPSAVRSQ